MDLAHVDRHLIDKLLGLKGRLILGNKRSSKTALVSYVLFPPYLSPNGGYYLRSHNSRLICRIFAECLLERGFCVHLTSFEDADVELPSNLKFFMGHNASFHKIAARVPKDTLKVLLTAGSSEEHTMREIKRRGDLLSQRKSQTIKLNYHEAVPDYPYKNFKIADIIYLLGGGGFVETTWYPEFKSKYVSYNNVIPFPIQSKRLGTGKGFIYMSSLNSLRRGLDLILDSFLKLPQTEVFLCGPYLTERDFVELYRKELFETPNIHSLGFVNLNSAKFKDAVRRSEFAILPSASEGQPGSLLNLMALGLIPVATKECGITDIDECGYLIQNGTLEQVEAAIAKAMNAPVEERDQKRKLVEKKCREFTPEFVRGQFQNFLSRYVE